MNKGISGASLGVGGDIWTVDNPVPFKFSELLLPEIIIEDYGTEQDYQRVMRPAFDTLWNAAGYSESKYFNKNNLWVGRSKR
ncbi:MAG TPA: hypothetical protein PK842_09750 [Smithella sp.]|nr:hypothetical protein [Deltaproteobacteria bacterium]HOO35274.1 hypothetical protein [Smithella sp.]HPK23055.1 hypothetical protein [Smithella sp.]HQC18388.1 hypothetical protein [Smithella sp.]HQL98352.1 hypothetical protein [Smithella sp.]